METAVQLAQVVSPLVALIVGITQCGLIWYGLKQMEKSSAIRTQQSNELIAGLRDSNTALRQVLQNQSAKG